MSESRHSVATRGRTGRRNDDEGPYLIRLVPELVAELAALPDDRVAAVASGWVAAAEGMGEPELEFITQLIGELRRVARQAVADGVDPYCWISV